MIKPAAVIKIAGIMVKMVHIMENRPCNCPIFPGGNSSINKKGAKLMTSKTRPMIKMVRDLNFFNRFNSMF